jgi:predicted O-methyltransferase YrrM
MNVDIEIDNGIAIANFRGVRGTLNGDDVKVLIELGRKIPENGRYLETGSYLGCSAHIIAESSKNTTLWCHDIWVTEWSELKGTPPPEVKDYFYEFYKNVKKYKLENRIIPVRGDSAYTIGIHDDNSIDLAFIDGDHSYEGCMADLKAVWPKMKSGATVIVHDCIIEEVLAAVNKFLEVQTNVRKVYTIVGTAMVIIELL